MEDNTMLNQLTAIVLAAGRGTRMKSPDTQNKVVLNLADKPMIRYTIDTLKKCAIDKIIVVVGFAKESVMAILGSEVDYAYQDNPLGTGHAVKVALSLVPAQATDVIVMYGDDSAFYTPELIDRLVTTHQLHQNKLTLVSLIKPNPYGLGRIIRSHDNQLLGVVEEKNADDSQRQITEINTGLYCFNTEFLKKAVDNLKPNPISQEYYLTDVIAYACKERQNAEALLWENQDIWHGVNTPEQLNAAEERMKLKNRVQ